MALRQGKKLGFLFLRFLKQAKEDNVQSLEEGVKLSFWEGDIAWHWARSRKGMFFG